jgi:hypothetical protein
MEGSTEKRFLYHATAHALSGQFWRPFQKVIEIQAPSSLPTIGGVGHSRVENFRLDSFVSFKAGYTHVLGSKKEATDAKGRSRTTHTTQVTSTVEGLNILDVVTADRIVARLTSTHDPEDEKANGEARIILTGSKFENFRIAGCEVDVRLLHKLFLDLDTFGAVRGLPEEHDFWNIAAETAQAIEPGAKLAKKKPDTHETLLCSVVKEAKFKCLDEGEDVCAGVTRYGRHRFHVKEFGSIYLGEVVFQHGQKTLTMLRIEFGSPNGGSLAGVEAFSNGRTWP